MRFLALLLMVGVAFAADPKVVSPANGVPLVGPYSPGLDTGDYVYVSGQGVRDSKSQMPEGIEAQTRQCVENVRGILSAAGLGLDSVVAVQLYLADLGNLPVVEQIYGAAFPKGAARVTLGVAKMPTDTTVEITVVARRAGAKADRVFVPAVYGNTQAEVEAKLAGELKKVGLAAKDVVYANRYVVGGEGAGTIPVAGLPGGAKRALFAIAAKTPPVGMAFCEVVASDVGGTVEEQTKSVFGKLQACLEGKGLGLSQALATNVYLDQIGDFAKMNAVYATYFPNQKPTRTTIQTAVSGGAGHPLVRLSALAGR